MFIIMIIQLYNDRGKYYWEEPEYHAAMTLYSNLSTSSTSVRPGASETVTFGGAFQDYETLSSEYSFFLFHPIEKTSFIHFRQTGRGETLDGMCSDGLYGPSCMSKNHWSSSHISFLSHAEKHNDEQSWIN